MKIKKYLQKKIPLLIILTFLVFLPVQLFCQESKIIELTAFDYPPFYFENKNGINGIAVDVAEELFGRMDIKPVFKIYPLKRALYSLETGKFDGMMFLIKNSEREEFLKFTIPVYTARGVIWSSADNRNSPVSFEDFSDLSVYKIGITRGYSYGETFDRYLKKADVDIASSDYQNYKKLLAGRIDIFPANEVVAKGLTMRYPELKNKFVHSRQSFVEWPLHMTLSKKSKYISEFDKINEILKNLISEGFIDRAVTKYTQ